MKDELFESHWKLFFNYLLRFPFAVFRSVEDYSLERLLGCGTALKSLLKFFSVVVQLLFLSSDYISLTNVSRNEEKGAA